MLARSNPTVNRRVSNFHDKNMKPSAQEKRTDGKRCPRDPFLGNAGASKAQREGLTAGRVILFSGAGVGRTMILEWKVLGKG